MWIVDIFDFLCGIVEALHSALDGKSAIERALGWILLTVAAIIAVVFVVAVIYKKLF